MKSDTAISRISPLFFLHLNEYFCSLTVRESIISFFTFFFHKNDLLFIIQYKNSSKVYLYGYWFLYTDGCRILISGVFFFRLFGGKKQVNELYEGGVQFFISQPQLLAFYNFLFCFYEKFKMIFLCVFLMYKIS